MTHKLLVQPPKLFKVRIMGQGATTYSQPLNQTYTLLGCAWVMLTVLPYKRKAEFGYLEKKET
jgi:hypothetical protein